ncbi:TPA_asm: coat protein [ssRNA phage Zoerhiza.4_8]|uniref:Coat protein n=2 Tax=Leviviricetes TaxID=2842243 RepID=A0A8S5L2A8_9VIRU|nr:coat protein [ssRNA phage Zoerhiza.4_8]QDH89285.1 MAG: hypothetical protein H4Rhizo43408_000002 [Leviviridae sp.]DAD51627.1 TPA_asm: coat protein [ssRNA phage Zoerhiza.4_8]
MAFAEPQTVTISGVANTLQRTGQGLGVGTFSTNDGALTLEIRNTYGKRIRRQLRFVHKKYASDPTKPAENIPVSSTVQIFVDIPVQGYTSADMLAIVVGALNNLTATSNANITKLLGGES